MAAIIAGYHVQENIYESENSLVYRGCMHQDGQAVILKMLKQSYPPPEKIAWFQREYELINRLHLEGVVTAYALAIDQHRPVMVLEDFGGESLELHFRKRQRRFTVAEFLPLAIQIADILGRVHEQHVMHKDVNPSNIVWNAQSGQVKLIDFGISTILSRENPTLRNPGRGEGTLAYMSPEQTGRMNRTMDYRTDLYSLGVSFYELLTGQLPFPTIDTLELMHAHLARKPFPPHDLIADICEPISAIVLKLMAKNAEDRYQSAYGLKADLEECLRQWRSIGRVETFPLSQHDVADRFPLPQKLYGRESETIKLLKAFDRTSHGAGELVLVSGYAGIGKSSLVQEIHKPITRQRGFFIAGKCDQLHPDIPYAPLVQAFRSLSRQLLTESKNQLEVWREKLLGALDPNGQVIVDLVPEIALIIGSQPPASFLPPPAARNRLNIVFHNFIRVFAQEEHPLVLFVDDLQWVDSASLSLLQRLLTADGNSYLLIIGAYRDNEVHDAHPFILTRDEIRKTRCSVEHLVLQPLPLLCVSQLIEDIFNCTSTRAKPLAELIVTKTAGNPFFVTEFLRTLYAMGLLTFDLRRQEWQWELTSLQTRNLTDNVVEMLADRIQQLEQPTQQVLKLASCIGSQFDLRTLATVYGRSPRDTAISLWGALEEGLILPLTDTYKLMDLDVRGLSEEVTTEYRFAHDRIQQAAYSLIPQTEKQIVHRRIGQLLLHNTPPYAFEQRIFDIADQLNLGVSQLNSHEEQRQLAELNLHAGRKAKAAAAPGQALKYLQFGIDLLRGEGWAQQYELALALYEDATEAAYLSGDYARMEQLSEVVLRQAKNLLDKVKVYECKIEVGYAVPHKLMEGIHVGLEVLQLLGIPLPEKPTQADIKRDLEATQHVLAGREIRTLLDLPEMTDPYVLATARILMRLFSPAFFGSPELFLLIVSQMVRFSIQYGNTPLSARAYAAYGQILITRTEEIDNGYAFGQLALELVERFNAKDIKASVLYMVNSFVRFWKEHVRDTLESSLEGYTVALETGAVEFAAVSAFSHNFKAYWSGKNLVELESDFVKYGEIIERLKQEAIANSNALHYQAALNLMGQAEDPCRLIGRSYDEESKFPFQLETQNKNALCLFHINKLVLCFLFQEFSQALSHANQAEVYLLGVQGTVVVPVYYFYSSLAQLAVFSAVDESQKRRILSQVGSNQEKMQHWSQHAPMNYRHKFYLVEAERACVAGNDRDAREYYDQAIDLAHEHEYVNEEALANELAAKFYLEKGQVRLGQHYLQDARYAYVRWGALAKVKDLETRYPQLLAQAKSGFSQTEGMMLTTSTGQYFSSALDFTSILHASQAISSEIHLDKLLTKLVALMIENAGAQRGVLILEKDGHLVIEAEKALDRNKIQTLQSILVETRKDLPLAILRYVERTKQQVVLSDATQEAIFATDPYIATKQPKSVLCAPLVKQGKLIGILYLENNLATDAFTPDRVEVLNLLAAEAAISIENARLYRSLEEANKQLSDHSKTLEQKVEERTHVVEKKNRELEIANLQVQEASRRKSQFLAGMSHQLRTPMNAILGFTRLVLRRAGEVLPERQRDNLGKVKESAEQLLTLINDLLDLSKIEAGRMDIHPEIFDVKRFVQACCETVAPLVKPTVQLRYEIADTVGEAQTDQDGLRQIVLNLLSNAIRFTEVGEVVVRVFIEKQPTSEERLGIAVVDTGVGIAAEGLGRIFDEFEQLAGSNHHQKGTGLGLPIAKRWAELLGGSITVESTIRKGSTFTITVPAVYSDQRGTSPESVSI